MIKAEWPFGVSTIRPETRAVVQMKIMSKFNIGLKMGKVETPIQSACARFPVQMQLGLVVGEKKIMRQKVREIGVK